MSEDLKVRPIEAEPSHEPDRSRDWGQIVGWTSILVVVLLAFLAVGPPAGLARAQDWYDNWQQSRYVQAHGIVTTPVATVQGPINGMTADAHGNVYALAGAHHILTVLHPDGTQTTIRIPIAHAFGQAITRGLGGEVGHGMVTLPNGATFIVDQWRNAIVRVAPDGSVDMNWLILDSSESNRVPTGLTHLSGDAAGNLYFVEWIVDSSKKYQVSIARINPDRSVTSHWASLKQMTEVEFPLAVSPGGIVYAFGRGVGSPSVVTDIFKVLRDPTLALMASHKPGSVVAKAPPPIQVGGSNAAVSADGQLWFMDGSIGTLLPSGKFASWWLKEANGSATWANAPFAITSQGIAYGVQEADQGKGAAVTIVRLTLPKTQ